MFAQMHYMALGGLRVPTKLRHYPPPRRSIPSVRSKPFGAIARRLLGGLVLAQLALPTAAHARGPTVYGALASLRSSDALSAEAYGEDSSAYAAALHAVGRLSGTRRAELGAVLANVQQIAAAGELTPSRLPALFLTLERNGSGGPPNRCLPPMSA